MSLRVDADGFRAWARLCADSLAEARAEIDALNVFPVPDADTGTNAYLTFAAGVDALDEDPVPEKLSDVLKRYGDALLMNAKGNCGTILSELVRGALRSLRGKKKIDSAEVVEALEAASDAAWAAVGDPQEGTILSVARAAAVGARHAHEAKKGARDVFEAAAAASREALLLTPTQMDRLAKAGVVDAGGRALVVVLESLSWALTGRVPTPAPGRLPVPAIETGADLDESGPSYEVMYLLKAAGRRITPLKEALSELGDSLVVVGGEGLWNVHVHVDDVGAAIEAGMKAGRPFRIRVTHFAEQIGAARKSDISGRAIITAVTGKELAAVVSEAGAVPLVFALDDPISMRAMSKAITDTNAAEVIVLPNREAHIPQFEAAAKVARDKGVRVSVLKTTVQVQGLAALAVHDPQRSFDEDVVAMSTAAGSIRHGAVTIAKEDGLTSAGPCKKGDVLGVVDGDFAFVGSNLVEISMNVLTDIGVERGEIVTMVVGRKVDDEVVAQIRQRVEALSPFVEFEIHQGGQRDYKLFLAVE